MPHSVREHLKATHEKRAEHHVEMAKIFSAMHKSHAARAESADGDTAAHHAEDAAHFKKAAEAHTNAAEDAIASAKELDAPTTKAAGAGDDGDRIVPDGISSILPSDVPIRKVLRPGQPDFDVDVSGVPEMFHKLVGPLEDEV